MIDKVYVMVLVLARLRAEGKDFTTVTNTEIDALVQDAVADLKLVDDALNKKETGQ